jgi:hypothetical protein
MNSDYALNPETNRMIKKNTSKYRRFVKMGIIVEDQTVPIVNTAPVQSILVQQPEPVQQSEPQQQLETEIIEDEIPIKAKLAKVSVNLIKKNTDAFRDLNEKETTKLLRKLLLAKLSPKKSKKKKKKSKYKIKESSSESSSESE